MSRTIPAGAVRPTIAVAGGGTGGHVFPGLAVADALRALADVDVVFVGTPRGLETRIVPPRGYPLELLDVSPMKGGGVARAVRGAAIASAATLRAVRLVARLRPRAVLSVGGYAAGPLALAAASLRVPVAILEPNAAMGLANRALFPLARRAYVAWPDLARSGSRAQKVRVLGVPLRAGFDASPYRASSSARVLVLGGSQGAAALNERVPEALARVAKDVLSLTVVHQTGEGRDDAVRAAYAREHVERVTVTPFLEDVASELARADLVIARAGAGAIAEIAAVGRASILIPFPHAADDHQAKNASSIAGAGGALCIRQEAADAVRIAREVSLLLGDPDRRSGMAAAARAIGRPYAARDVARDLLDVARIEPRPAPPRSRVNGQSAPAREAR